jgi:FkbM family methyltransferase
MTDYPVRFEGKTLTFAVSNENDTVQRNHVRGRFYEVVDLIAHRQLIPYKGVVIDVGANVGNHTLFYARHTKATAVYPLEPNAVARELLLRNIEANGLADRCNLAAVNYGAGSTSMRGSVVDSSPNNLGQASLSFSDDGAVQIEMLDTLFENVLPDFIKIDVEGMEMAVLAGAVELFKRARPSLAIEVDSNNIPSFWKWADAQQYQVINAFKAHRPNINYLCISRR